MSDQKSPEQLLADAETARAERKAKLRAAAAEQRLIDLDALSKAELEHGDSMVAHIDVPHSPGLPTMVIVRCVSDPELKRYRFRMKPDKDGTPGNSVDAAEEAADNTVLYPDEATYKRLRGDRPGVHAQAGAAAVQLAIGKAAAEGKG